MFLVSVVFLGLVVSLDLEALLVLEVYSLDYPQVVWFHR